MIAATGRQDSKIFILGEAPGKEELRQGMPFVGATGRILWAVAREAGFDRSSCFVTNVVQSDPEGASGAPSRRQVLEEWERLDEEMAAATGCEIMVLVGGIALQRVTGLTNITNLRGYILDPAECLPVKKRMSVRVGEYKTSKTGKFSKGDPKFAMKSVAVPPILPPNVKYIVPILHPAGIMRMRFKTMPALKADLLRVGRLFRGEAEIMSPEDILVGEPIGNRVAIDIETPMPPDDWVVERVGLGAAGGVASYEWNKYISEHVEQVITAPENTVVFHNSSFDIPRLGFPLRARLFDTMYAAQLLCPDLPKGLERAATLHLDLRRWKHMADSDPAKYNAMDARVTYELSLAQERILKSTGQMPVFETMMKGLPVLMDLTRKGIRVDTARVELWVLELEERLAKAHVRWPRPDVNPLSPKQLQRYLYQDLGLPLQYSKHGTSTSDEAAIFHLLETATGEAKEALECLREIRECGRNLSTYAKVEAGKDGCVHPQYMAASKDEAEASFTSKGQGAGTGRIQARDPNIMNQNEDARKLYVPRHPDWCFAYIDWSSAEARVEAVLSGDDVLLEAINGDLHETIRAALKIGRTQAKNVFYGTGRGAGPRKLSWTMADAGFNVSETECREMQDNLFRLFPKWAKWRNTTIDFGKSKGYVQNPFGRRRYFYTREAVTSMLGFTPQSTVADMLWSILPDVSPWLVVPVHDAVLIEAPEEAIQPAVREVEKVMGREWPMIVPEFRVPVTAKIGQPGQSWGEIA